MKRFIAKSALLLFLWLPSLLRSQATVTFDAVTDAKQVLLNSSFEVNFLLKNANGTDFSPPDFEGFRVLSGPNTTSSMQIVNGRVSREMGYSYMLQPKRTGKISIGSAAISANGKKMTTQALQVEVVKSASGISGSKGKNESPGSKKQQYDLFVRAIPSTTNAYIGEQIRLDYKLYTAVQVDGYDIPQEPDYPGFFVQEIRRFDTRTSRETVNGKEYVTVLLRRLALFPQQAGKLSVPPLTLQLTVVNDEGAFGSFFSRGVKPVMFTTDEVDLNIEALPPGAPEDFSGAVGKYECSASINRNSATTDDAVAVTMVISGNGDQKRALSPPLLLSDSFEVYAPKILDDNSNDNSGEISGKKVVEHLVLPKYPGTYNLTPSFSYFDPNKKEYVTLKQGPFPLRVRQGSDRHANVDDQKEKQQPGSDIRYLKTETTLRKKSSPFVGSALFWMLTALPVLAFFGLFFYKKNKERHLITDSILLKSSLANKEAQRRLLTAGQHLRSGSSRAFYDEVSKASLGYICDKLNIPLATLTKDNVREKLQSLAVGEALVADFMRILQTCEMALFAGMDNAEPMQVTYDKAVAVISGMEEGLGKIR